MIFLALHTIVESDAEYFESLVFYPAFMLGHGVRVADSLPNAEGASSPEIFSQFAEKARKLLAEVEEHMQDAYEKVDARTPAARYAAVIAIASHKTS